MSQYGKIEYWEERYTRSFFLILFLFTLFVETQNHLIGIKGFRVLRIY